MSIRHATLHRSRGATIIKHFNQDDGTWTDIPRCVEHEPGVEEQIPGLCPGVSGYCATGFLNGRCRCQKVPTGTKKKTNPLTVKKKPDIQFRFDCTTGRDIDSICTADGTWAPYPTCQVLHMSSISPSKTIRAKWKLELSLGRQTGSARWLWWLPWSIWWTKEQVSMMIAMIAHKIVLVNDSIFN